MRALLAIFILSAGVMVAQDPPTPSKSAAGAASARQDTNSPVEFFRKLLAMNPAEREKALAEKPEKRAYLKVKLKEYDALTPAEREVRLRVTQLRYYLTPLLSLKPDERAPHLELIPAEDRKFIEERLAQWDGLPAELQREVLENEWLIHTVLRLQSSSPAHQKELLDAMSPDRRERLEHDLAKWSSLAADKRARMLANFNQFFELNEKEKSKILKTVPGSERSEIEKTLLAFEQLPPEQRTLCINSLKRFASMTPEQQLQFFSNAERWAKLSDVEKQLLRQLVVKMPPLPPMPTALPPMPPGFGEPPAAPLPVLGTTNR